MASDSYISHHTALQRCWATALFGALRHLYQLTLIVEGLEVLDHTGPLLVLSRHTSAVSVEYAIVLPVIM